MSSTFNWIKENKKIKIVLLDAGHGGMIDGVYQTKGKRSPVWEDGSQYFEGVGNRMIRDYLAKMLREAGIRYKYVNEGERDMSLKQRVSIINAYARKYGKNNCLVISIHSDAFREEQAHGWSVYTSPNQTRSDLFATDLYHTTKGIFYQEKYRTQGRKDGDPDKEAKFYILTKTICPAILSENFFMTNERECKEILMTKWGQKNIAKAHFEMIKMNYYETAA